MLHPGKPLPEGTGPPASALDHPPHAIGRFASAASFLAIWAGCAGIAFWGTTPPANAGVLWVTGGVLAAIAGFAVAKIKPLRPRRRVSLALGVVCVVLPFLLAAALR